jgi:hypothetical protein
MKPRHAAALALVGWYLMAPPMNPDKNVRVNAPLSQWQIVDSFDNAQDCHDKKARLTSDMMNRQPELGRRALHSACISTDDPRLKEK